METRMKKHIVKAVIAIMLVLTLCSSTVSMLQEEKRREEKPSKK